MNVGVRGAGISALLDCLPGMAFTLTLFRKRLRLGVRATVAVCALLVVIQVVAGSLRYRHVDDNAYMALMAILLPVLWGFPVIGLIRDSLAQDCVCSDVVHEPVGHGYCHGQRRRSSSVSWGGI